MRVVIYTDGASRGNPGVAGIAYRIEDATGRVVAEQAEPIGIATNNEAEYRALEAALERALALGATAVDHFTDSQLLVRQLAGEYRLRAENLRPLLARIRALASRFARIEHRHVRREHPGIVRVDAAVNRALDLNPRR